jgi:Patatin phospholipase
MTSTDASARITPLTAKRESSPLEAKPPSTRRPEDISTSMIDHWNAGYSDAIRTLRHPEALQRPVNGPGVATFDVVVDGRE